jgi:iron complex outermembrane recepter protein
MAPLNFRKIFPVNPRRVLQSILNHTMAALLFALPVSGQEADVKKLKLLTIEELMNLEVTSVAKGPQKLTEVASAIQVITREDILRSGATCIPEALRLAPNLQVAQLNSSAWIISARGFNTVFANKLLVLIDGRTVYTPLFGGVLWDLQSVLLEDVERIEVISGPGGTLWGANAVNGVINIITKKAKESQGLFASAAIGDQLRNQFAARYGTQINDKAFFRIYAQHAARNATFLADETRNKDDWRTSQAGFRLGLSPTEKDFISVQGDAYKGEIKSEPDPLRFDGQNVLTRWTRTINERSDIIVQIYYDRYWRHDPAVLSDEMQTYDLDFQHRLPIGDSHNLLWGAGYRMVKDNVYNRSIYAGLVPENRNMPLYSGFIQDEITVADNIHLTLGTKILHNIFSGFELQPSARISAVLSEKNTVWAAASRAVRAPSRLDVDYRLPIEPQPPTVPSVAGGPNFDSEKLHAYELGYRTQPHNNVSLSFALFYNEYKDVYSVETVPETLTYQIQNGSEAESWGGEFSAFYQVMD